MTERAEHTAEHTAPDQSVSVRELADAILDAPAGSATQMARALLARYSITKRTEG